MDASDIRYFKSVNKTTNPATNGGVRSENEILTNQVGATFSHTFQADRDNGKTETVKLFVALTNSDDLPLVGAIAALWGQNKGGEEYSVLYEGTQRGTEAEDITLTSRYYAPADLVADYTAGITDIQVDVRGTNVVEGIKAGDAIVVTNKPHPGALTGTQHETTVDTIVSTVGSVLTIRLASGLPADFGAADTVVFPHPAPADIQTSITDLTVTLAGSSGYSYDDTNYNVETSNIGCIEEDWELEFTDNNGNFQVSRKTIAPGVIGTGNKDADFEYQHPARAALCIRIPAAAHQGNPEAGDKVAFTSHPAEYPVWERQFTPVGSAPTPTSRLRLYERGQVANP